MIEHHRQVKVQNWKLYFQAADKSVIEVNKIGKKQA